MFEINLDDIIDDLWHELERVSDDSGMHRIRIRADEAGDAATLLAERLIPFFSTRMEEVEDDWS